MHFKVYLYTYLYTHTHTHTHTHAHTHTHTHIQTHTSTLVYEICVYEIWSLVKSESRYMFKRRGTKIDP